MATFDKTSLKSAMLRDKGFLRDLYGGSGPYNLKKLQNATDQELNTLLKVLYFITNGEIKIKKAHFDHLMSNNKIKSLRQNFESKKTVLNYLKGERVSKIKVLRLLVNVYSVLLYPLFNE